MASFNVSLANAKFYSVTRLDVIKGQIMDVELLDAPPDVKWLFTNDPVLDIIQEGNEAEVKSVALGTSDIYIVDANFSRIIQLSIRVVAEVNADAIDLGVKVDPPILK